MPIGTNVFTEQIAACLGAEFGLSGAERELHM